MSTTSFEAGEMTSCSWIRRVAVAWVLEITAEKPTASTPRSWREPSSAEAFLPLTSSHHIDASSGVGSMCAALSSNVDGTQSTVLLVLTVAWLLIAASCVVNALRTAAPDDASPVLAVEAAGNDEELGSEPR
jgi:hypothetical protein